MEKDVCIEEPAEPPDIGTDCLYPRLSAAMDDKFSSLEIQVENIINESRRKHSFKISSKIRRFKEKYFPNISLGEWSDWRWQLNRRFTFIEQLDKFLKLTPQEFNSSLVNSKTIPLSITPYYAALLDPEDPMQGLRRSVVPHQNERVFSKGESSDPLHEENQSPVLGLIHRYPDRVLFLAVNFCSVFCRYCTRSRFIENHPEAMCCKSRWAEAIEYIRSNTSIRDVLISGGDPLTLDDDSLKQLLTQIRQIKHVEIIRIGTKIPAVLPQRITPQLTKMLKKFHPLWMSLHFTHPDELTPETAQACARLADAGIPLGSQTVLLAGINDNTHTIKKLMHGLLMNRVRPYYLYQCDPIPGSSHFRTPVNKGLEIIKELRGHTTGYAVPQFVVDAPGGGGKIPLSPDYISHHDNDDLVLFNYEGRACRYPDPINDSLNEKTIFSASEAQL